MRKNTDSEHGVTIGSDYWMSYTDIMTGLLLVFIILIIFLVVNVEDIKRGLDEKKKELLTLEQERQELIKEKDKILNVYEGNKDHVKKMIGNIDRGLRGSGIAVETDIDNYTLHISNESFGFVKGKYEIKEQKYLDIITKMRDEIYKYLSDTETGSKYIDTIFIEGHTDIDPYNNPQLKGNWGLSTMRAISFWEKIVDDGSGLSMEQIVDKCSNVKNKNFESSGLSWIQYKTCYFLNLENINGKKMFSVSGYAATRPTECAESFMKDHLSGMSKSCLSALSNVKNEQTYQEKADALNRRIDIRFVPRTPTATEIQDALNKKVN